jgi:hypothetical protein
MMTEVTVKVPQEMSKIIAETSQTLYLEAIKEVVARRLSSTQQRLLSIQEEIQAYEKKYKSSYQEFAEHVPDTMEGHDDWIEWSYLVKVVKELDQKMNKLHLLIGQ